MPGRGEHAPLETRAFQGVLGGMTQERNQQEGSQNDGWEDPIEPDGTSSRNTGIYSGCHVTLSQGHVLPGLQPSLHSGSPASFFGLPPLPPAAQQPERSFGRPKARAPAPRYLAAP